MRFLVVIFFVSIPAFAEVGAEGILTYFPQRCMENLSPSDRQLTSQLVNDEQTGSANLNRDVRRLKLKLEKLKCLYGALTSYSFGVGLSVENMEAHREYKVVISQLALYAGSKNSELNKLYRTPSCTQQVVEDRALCINARMMLIIQSQAMIGAINEFIDGYADAVERQPKFMLNRVEAQIEKGILEKIKRLSEQPAASSSLPGVPDQSIAPEFVR